jgi:hypothetical protein
MTMRALGLVLIVLGVLAFTYQGVIWVTTREQVAKIGPIEVNAERDRAIPLAPIIGGVAIGAGALLMLSGRRATT